MSRTRLLSSGQWLLLLAVLVLTVQFMPTGAVSTALASGDVPPVIPMEEFFRNPERSGYDLSYDGQYISFRMPWQNRMNVHIQKVGSDEVIRITEATERDIPGYGWANNNRIIYVMDSGGDENYHVFAVDIDGGNPLELTPFEGVRAGIVDVMKENKEEMLIRMNKRDPQLFDVYRVNVNTGEMELAAENPGTVEDWITDHDGKVRAAKTSDGVNTSLLYRQTEADDWTTVVTTSFKDGLDPLQFTFDNRYLYVSSNLDRDKQAIYTYDPRTGEFLDLIYEHDQVDVSNLIDSEKRKIITGVSFTTDKRQYHWFDEWRGNLQATIEDQLPGYEVALTAMSDDEDKALVRTYSDKSSGAYYFYDIETEKLTKLVEVSPWIDESLMCDQKPIQYQSRDGLTIHGYLTLPRGVEPKNLPVVILPHGGPWARDNWGFDPEVQFFANRGYGVLQMNFRSSTGYGKSFWQAGFKQWGLTMQDDITDGVEWLIGQGIADRGRVGIYGVSYGGYAVLAGLAFTPDLYACGVDYVGISSLFTVLESLPPYWELGRQMFYEMMGDPEQDKELLEQISPLFHADQITAPLYVFQGANDPRVNIREADQMVAALQERGVEVKYMVKDNEGHYFRNEENRFDVFREVDMFLAEHLGGRCGSYDE
ncbi:MAG: S9 family peptidase [bacterium]